MPTKQEILDKYVRCECWPVKDGGKKVYNSSCPQHSTDPESAMDEWALNEITNFLSWSKTNECEYQFGGGTHWVHRYDSFDHKTTTEVYQLFKTQQQNK